MKMLNCLAGSMVLAFSLQGCGATPGLEGDSFLDEALQSDEAQLGATYPIFLNHAYGMFPQATIDALQTNAYLKNTFVDVEVRTTVRPDTTYTGTYLNTRSTYMEFFPVGTFGFPLGVMAIALGDEYAGGLDALHQRWTAEFGPSQPPIVNISREVNGVTKPWFRMAEMGWTYTSDYTAFWGMEYVPQPGSTQPITRLQERSTRYNPARLAKDVEILVFGTADADREPLRRTLTSAGLTVLNTNASGTEFIAFTANDPTAPRKLYFKRATPGHQGLLAIVYSLNKLAQHHTEPLGGATLEVGFNGLPAAVLWMVTPTAEETDLVSRLTLSF